MQEKPNAKTDMIQGRYRTLLTIWVVILWSIAIIISIPVIVGSKPVTATDNKLFWVFAGVCLFLVIMSFALKGILLSRAEAQQNLAQVVTAYIVAFALCEASCIVALVASFTGVSRYYYLLFIPGPLFLLLHMPRKEKLLAATYQGQR